MKHITLLTICVLLLASGAAFGDDIMWYGNTVRKTTCAICGLPISYMEYDYNNFLQSTTTTLTSNDSDSFPIYGWESGYQIDDGTYLCPVCFDKFAERYTKHMDEAQSQFIESAKSESADRVETVKKALHEKDVREAKEELERIETKRKELEEFLNEKN